MLSGSSETVISHSETYLFIVLLQSIGANRETELQDTEAHQRVRKSLFLAAGTTSGALRLTASASSLQSATNCNHRRGDNRFICGEVHHRLGERI